MHSAAEDDVYDVYDEVYTMARNWRGLARSLRLPPTIVSLIATKYANDPNECLFSVLQEWLKRIQNVQRHGCPSWYLLVKAVAHPAGGGNPALADTIAQKYSGECQHVVICCMHIVHLPFLFASSTSCN